MAERWRRWVVLLSLAALGCGGEAGPPRPQWRIELTTDVSIPQLGDRLLVEVLNEGSEIHCDACRRQFGVVAPEEWDFSFGLVPPEPDETLRVRARLFRSRQAGPDGLPLSLNLIDAVGVLPPIAGEGRVGLHLGLACFGVAADLGGHQSCDVATGALGPEPVLGPPLELEPPVPEQLACSDGEVCFAGGAFVLGNERRPAAASQLLPVPERLVTLSSFALDARELTVGTVRRLLAERRALEEPIMRGGEGEPMRAACTYVGRDDPAGDTLPVNCLSAAEAEALCAAQGKRLPTEAEWEFAARSRGLDLRYAWADESDPCDRAVVGVGRYSLPGSDSTPDESVTCRRPQTPYDDPWGPRASGAVPDVTPLGLFEMNGNVAEWTADAFSPYSDACWSLRDLDDPRCTASWSDPEFAGQALRALRGGAWNLEPFQVEPTSRKYGVDGSRDPGVGVRCARSL